MAKFVVPSCECRMTPCMCSNGNSVCSVSVVPICMDVVMVRTSAAWSPISESERILTWKYKRAQSVVASAE